MRPIPAALRGGPFTRAEALAHGVSDRELAGSRFIRRYRGVYVHRRRARARFRATPGRSAAARRRCAATHVTGPRCHGVAVGRMLPLRFATTRGRDTGHEGMRLIRRMRLARHENGALSPEQCRVDACLDLDLLDAVIAADWLVELGGTTMRRLTRFVESTDNWEGIRTSLQPGRLRR